VSTGVDGGVFSEDPNEILVFGYGAKLFRDDEKASWIDREEHLIPWMGDPELKVDRYDGRGALMDLRPFVAKAGGYSEKMDEEERELEKVLDHERYSDLREDEDFNDMEYQGTLPLNQLREVELIKGIVESRGGVPKISV